jgi:hypothetical protein
MFVYICTYVFTCIFIYSIYIYIYLYIQISPVKVSLGVLKTEAANRRCRKYASYTDLEKILALDTGRIQPLGMYIYIYVCVYLYMLMYINYVRI